jgi:hypothetical protein
MKNLRTTILLVLFGILTVVSCEKTEDRGDTVFIHNGSVNGTLKGTKTDISTTDNAPCVVSYHLTYYKTLSSKVAYYFSMSNSNNILTISNFSFNEATGQLKCKLTATGVNNSTKNNATIEANYDVILKKMTY